MSAIPISSKQMTLEEYLEFDYSAEGRYEYYDGEVFEMSGSSPEHSLLGNRAGFLLQRELLQKSRFVFNSEVLIKVPAMLPYRYGDVSASCGKPAYEDLGNQRLPLNPALIVEVLSPSTEKFDRELKFKAYKSIESLRDYLLISQEQKFVTLYTKHNERFWFQSEYVEGENLKLDSLDCELSVDEIYRGILES